MKYYILFGPPGAGKGTHSTALTEKYNLKHISTGELLRAEIAAGTELGKQAKTLIDAGALVPDSVVEGMIESAFDTFKDCDGFLLDGFPRNLAQAEDLDRMLEKRGESVTAVLSIMISDDLIRRRIAHRAAIEGRADDATVFAADPVAAARDWEAQGARWLHVVDLDGAFDGQPKSRDIVRNICAALSIPVQLGGGIRDESVARAYLDAGVQRLIIGTLALEAPEAFAALCRAFPGRIGVSLDAEGGRLKTKGWVSDAGLTIDDVLPRLLRDGAAFIIYTDIERDGMQSGVNVEALRRLATLSTVPVIAAGGVATMDDVRALYPLTKTTRLQGAISGRALYEGTLSLPEANAWIDAQG